MISVFTIGFTQTSAEEFFEKLRTAGIQKVVDVRLNNSSQLAGFSKRDDLRYFLKTIAKIDYSEEPLFAPTQSMLESYRKQKGSWPDYERAFRQLLRQRKVEEKTTPSSLQMSCLLCSEKNPHYCHRRVVLEYLNECWGTLKTIHLV
ncbi:MAG: DUF488 domain-containing protein [Verrucomicrobiota bacterium]|nr:DUF488 domain-containing protein [Verrucomicrobiota bacterium]